MKVKQAKVDQTRSSNEANPSKPRLSMKLLWKLFTHASAPKNDVASFLEFVEVYMKPLKP